MFIINAIIMIGLVAFMVVVAFILGFHFCMGYMAITEKDIQRSTIARKEAELGSNIIKYTM